MTCFPCSIWKRRELRKYALEGGGDVRIYTYRELSKATNNFSSANKIGEGGFGNVYLARFKDGTVAAVKVLTSESKQGAIEFLNEINVISRVVHETLVGLLGCCLENDHRILVYEYLENNSLSQSLLGGGSSDIQFCWKTRTQICISVARGLAYLHEEIQPHIVHRDIKASNILLDKDLNAKISDFGLARFIPPELTHVSTRVAGTLGYLAPEYAVRGYLTRRADVYSFGVLLIEVVSGRCNMNTKLPSEDCFLIERTWLHYERNQELEMVDTFLDGKFDPEEARRFIKVGLLCTQDSPKVRPKMSQVVKMLTGEINVDMETVTKPGIISDFTLMKVRSLKKEEKKLHQSSGSSGLDCSSQDVTTQASTAFTSSPDAEQLRHGGASLLDPAS